MILDKQKIVIIILAVGLVLTVQYFLLDKWMSLEQQQKVANFQQGYGQGMRDAVITLYKQTENCTQATITIANLTKTVLDVSCLHNQMSLP